MKTIGNVFKALSDVTRLRIMVALLRAKKELCICEIMDTLALAQYHVSRHIRELKIAGLVQERKEGRFVFYSAVRPADPFNRYIIKALESLDSGSSADDMRRLKKRLSLREDGKCVVGMRGGNQ